MSGTDANGSLPVRTQTNGDVVAQLVDGTTTTQKLGIDASGRITIKLDDGSGNLVTSQVSGGQRALDVGINVSGTQIDPRQIRALTAADVVTANQGTANTTANAWPQKITDGTNVAAVKAASTAAIATDPALVIAFSPNTSLPTGANIIGKVELDDGAGNSVTSQVNGAQRALDVGINVAGVQIDPRQIRALTSSDVVTVQAITTALPAGSNTLGNVNAFQGGAANTNANPFFVAITNTTPGTPVNFYNATASIAALGTATSTYTITSTKTLSVKKVTVGSAVKMRHDFEISTNGSTFTTIFTAFTTTANPMFVWDLDEVSVSDTGTGAVVHVISTNEDLVASSAYVAVNGVEN